jgi:hypothetical protein
MIEEDMKDVNELYHSLEIPKDNLSYNYPGLEYFNEEFPTHLKEDDNVHICAYNINSLNKYPFIQYFLYKPYGETSFSFPTIIYKNDMDLLTKSMTVINVLCSSYYKDTLFNYKGFIQEEDDVYLFFDCSHMKIDTVKINEFNDLWLAIIDEIINYKSVYGFHIDDYVVDLFHNYEKLSYLTDDEDSHHPMPIIGYSKCDVNAIDFISTFGIQQENRFLGNYYYFSDYETVLKKIDVNTKKVGFIRCVVFTEKMNIISEKYTDSITEKIVEWKNNLSLLFDSVLYISTEDLLWGIKNYNQYFVLSVHVKNV